MLATTSFAIDCSQQNMPDSSDVLDGFASHVHSLPGINGVAIVALRGREMVCCARKGNAPELGTRITTDAKLSLECISTGAVVVCNDTQLDSRFCGGFLSLVKAIAVIPLFSGESVAGLLEVMSSQAGVFDDAFIRTLLTSVAGLMEEPAFNLAHERKDWQQASDINRKQADDTSGRLSAGPVTPNNLPGRMSATSLLLAILLFFSPAIVWQVRDIATERDRSGHYQDRTRQQNATNAPNTKSRPMPVLTPDSGSAYLPQGRHDRQSQSKWARIHASINPHRKAVAISDAPSVDPRGAEVSLTAVDASELLHLGDTFRFGSGVPRDYIAAVKFYRAAADQGNVTANDNLGDMYAEGQGVTLNYQEAVKLYRLAAEEGYAVAQNHLGDMLRDGKGILQDFAEAAKWYRIAAENGNPAAQDNFAQALQTGSGVAKDDFEALRWSRAAANQGYATAQIHVGDMLRDGIGVDRDYGEAMQWYLRAARQGSAVAKNNIGDLYRDGKGVPKDYAQASSWYRLAAATGLSAAAENLAELGQRSQN